MDERLYMKIWTGDVTYFPGDYKCDGTKYAIKIYNDLPKDVKPVIATPSGFIDFGDYKYCKQDIKKLRIIKKGREAEKLVNYELKWLGENFINLEKKCIQSFDGIDFPCIKLFDSQFINESQEYDHILISDNKVYCIETKGYYGKIIIKENGNWIRQIDGIETGIENPQIQVDRHHKLLSYILRDYVDEEDIIDIICVADKTSIIEGDNNSDIPVVKYDNLGRFISNIDNNSTKGKYDKYRIKELIENKLDSNSLNLTQKKDIEYKRNRAGLTVEMVRNLIFEQSDFCNLVYKANKEDIIINDGKIYALITCPSSDDIRVIRLDILNGKIYVQIPFDHSYIILEDNSLYFFGLEELNSEYSFSYLQNQDYMMDFAVAVDKSFKEDGAYIRNDAWTDYTILKKF